MTLQKPPVAGVRLGRNGPLVFVQVQGLEVSAGDSVVVRMADGEESAATVTIAPGQLLNPSGLRPAGEIVSVKEK